MLYLAMPRDDHGGKYLEAAQRRELWLQDQIDQIQQRLLPPPRQSLIERIGEVIAKLRRSKGNA